MNFIALLTQAGCLESFAIDFEMRIVLRKIEIPQCLKLAITSPSVQEKRKIMKTSLGAISNPTMISIGPGFGMVSRRFSLAMVVGNELTNLTGHKDGAELPEEAEWGCIHQLPSSKGGASH